MRSRPIYQYIWFGTAFRYLLDAQKGWPVHGDGRILDNIKRFLDGLAEYELPVTARTAGPLVELNKQLEATQPDHALTAEEVSRLTVIMIDQAHLEFGITYCGNEDGESYKPKLVITYTLPLTPQTEEMFEHYNVGDDTTALVYDTTWLSQTFTPSKKHTITSVRLKLLREGLPHDLTVSIRATSEGVPSGEDLCIAEIDGDTLTEDEEGAWYKITFETGVVLDVVEYAVVCRALEGVGGDAVLWRENQTESTYIGGSKVYSDDSGDTWEIMEPEDFMFEEWGYELIVPTEEKFESQESSSEYEDVEAETPCGQTFTPQITHKLTKVILKLNRFGEPEGDFIVSIRETADGLPSGEDLVFKSMLAMDILEEPESYIFIFDTQITLQKNQMYAIVMRCPDSDTDNKVLAWFEREINNPYPRGTWTRSDDLEWWLNSDYDFYFSEWGY